MVTLVARLLRIPSFVRAHVQIKFYLDSLLLLFFYSKRRDFKINPPDLLIRFVERNVSDCFDQFSIFYLNVTGI